MNWWCFIFYRFCSETESNICNQKLAKYVWRKSLIHQGVVYFRGDQDTAKNVCQRSVSDASEAFTQDGRSCEASHGEESPTKSQDIEEDKSFLEAVILQVGEFKFGGFNWKLIVSALPYWVHWTAHFLTKSLSAWVVLFVDVALSELLFEWGPLIANRLDRIAEAERLALSGWLYNRSGGYSWLFWHGLSVKI